MTMKPCLDVNIKLMIYYKLMYFVCRGTLLL